MRFRRYQHADHTVLFDLLDELFPDLDADFDVEVNGRVWKRFKPKDKG